MIDKAREIAERHELNPDVIEDIFRFIIEKNKELQKDYIKKQRLI